MRLTARAFRRTTSRARCCRNRLLHERALELGQALELEPLRLLKGVRLLLLLGTVAMAIPTPTPMHPLERQHQTLGDIVSVVLVDPAEIQRWILCLLRLSCMYLFSVSPVAILMSLCGL